MPRRRTRPPGILLALALCAGLAGCAVMGPGGTPDAGVAAVSPAPAPSDAGAARGAGWAVALTFSGELAGTMSAVAPADPGAGSECTGRNSRHAGGWASTLFGLLGNDVYGVVVTVRPYRGPGAYRAPDVSVQVLRPDGSAVWRTSGSGRADFVVAGGEESGALDATLTDLSDDRTTLRVTGTLSCQT